MLNSIAIKLCPRSCAFSSLLLQDGPGECHMIYGSCVCCIHIQMLCTHILASTDAQEEKHICTCALAHTVCTHSMRMTNSRRAVHVRRQDGHRRGFSVYAKHACDTSMLKTAHEPHAIQVCRSHMRINTPANIQSPISDWKNYAFHPCALLV